MKTVIGVSIVSNVVEAVVIPLTCYRYVYDRKIRYDISVKGKCDIFRKDSIIRNSIVYNCAEISEGELNDLKISAELGVVVTAYFMNVGELINLSQLNRVVQDVIEDDWQ